MPIKHLEQYRDSDLSRQLVEKIKNISQKKVRLMEVCGTHTVSIFRTGIRSLLPDTITLLSGPGCPVCVTDQREIDAFIELSRIDGVITTTFGDVMRVPGTHSSLQKERADGRDIRIEGQFEQVFEGSVEAEFNICGFRAEPVFIRVVKNGWILGR